MIRLLFSDLKKDPRGIIAPFLASLTCGVWVALAISFWMSVKSPAGQQALENAAPGAESTLAQINVFMLVLGIGMPSVFVLSAIGILRVVNNRTRYASWRLAGAAPAQVFLAILVQTIVVAAVASLVGSLIAAPLLQPGADFLLSVTDLGVSIPTRTTPVTIGLTLLAVSGVSAVAAIRPGRSASRIPPVLVLVDESATQARPGPGRFILASVILAAAIGLGAAATNEKYNGSASSLVLLCGILGLTFIAVLGPIIFPVFVSAWTRAVPPTLSAAWYVARQSAVGRLASTTATVTRFMIGAGLFGVYFSAAASWHVASQGNASVVEANSLQGLVLFTPAAIIATIGSMAMVFMAGRNRDREFALIRSVGGAPVSLAVAPAFEALIYAISALVPAILVTLVSTMVYGQFLVNQGYPWSLTLDLRASALVALLAWTGALLAIGLPTLRASRQSPGEALAIT